LRLCTLMGADVTLAPAMVLLLAIGVLIGEGPRLVLTFFFVLCHELCHTAAARYYSADVGEIALMPFGGVARLTGSGELTKGEWVIAIVGPLFNFIMAGLCMGLAAALPDYAPHLKLPFTINMTMGLFNLLPAYPLDGGRVLRCVLRRLLKNGRGERAARYIGMGTGAAVMAYGILTAAQLCAVNPMLFFVGGHMIHLANREGNGAMLSAFTGMEQKRRTLRRGVLEQRVLTAQSRMPIKKAAGLLHKRRFTAFCVVDDTLTPLGTVYEEALLGAILAGNSHKTLGELLRNQQ